MGLLQQEFLPVLQPSIQTADRYQVETPAHSVLFVPCSPAHGLQLCPSVLVFMLYLFVFSLFCIPWQTIWL